MKKYNTEQRELLYRFFKANCDRQFSVANIAETLCKKKKISISAVYRNICELEKEGLVRKFANEGSRNFLYQYIDKEKCADHLHLQCTECGKICHLSDDATKIIITAALERSSFTIDGKQTTIYGRCADCGKSGAL